jgi:hypothetical protein
MDVRFDPHKVAVDEVAVTFRDVPLLRCPKCEVIYLPNRAKEVAAFFVEKSKKNGKRAVEVYPTGVRAKRFPYGEVHFLYSALDHDFIPGLARPWDDGFLTPVFFRASVLNKYAQDPTYVLDLFSDTYGSILKGNEINVQFGINRSGKIVMWLGDIAQLPVAEQHYLRSENIESDHDVFSEFYDAQIDCVFAELSMENRAVRARSDLNARCREILGEDLYQLHGEIARVIEDLRRPLFWEEKHVAPAAESFNRIMVESLNVAVLKKQLEPRVAKENLKNVKGLKLLQAWLEKALGSAEAAQLCSPFFVLYDFRVLVCHLTSDASRDEKLAAINERLGLQKANQKLDAIYFALLPKLSDSLQKIGKLVV